MVGHTDTVYAVLGLFILCIVFLVVRSWKGSKPASAPPTEKKVQMEPFQDFGYEGWVEPDAGDILLREVFEKRGSGTKQCYEYDVYLVSDGRFLDDAYPNGNVPMGTKVRNVRKADEGPDGLCYRECPGGYRNMGPFCFSENFRIKGEQLMVIRQGCD